MALVTDAMAAAGVGSIGGAFKLGGRDVVVRDGVARGPGGELAGSVLTMIGAVRNLHALGVPLEDALDAATAVPAAVLGLTGIGRLDIGSPADVVVLGDSLEIERVYGGGEARVVA